MTMLERACRWFGLPIGKPILVADPFARAGDVVTCENGHEICKVAEDINRHEPIRLRNFTDWKIQPGVAGGFINSHCICGAEWFEIGIPIEERRIHINGEWRP